MTKTKLSKKLKVLALTFVVMIGGYVFYRHWLKVELETKLNEFRAAGYPVNCQELNKWYSIEPNIDNAADVITKAFSHYNQRHWNKLSKLPYFEWSNLPKWEPFSDQTKKLAEEYLADNERTLKLLHEGTKIAHCRYPIDFTQGYNLSWQHLTNLKTSVILLQIEALLNAEKDQPEQVITSIEAMLELADSLSAEPSLMSQIVKIRLQYFAVDTFQWVLNRTVFSDGQLKKLGEMFLVKDLPAMQKGIAGERCLFIDASQKSTSKLISLMDAHNYNAIAKIYFSKLTGLLDIDSGIYLDMMSDYINIYKLPLHKRMKAIEDIKSKYEAVSQIHFMFRSFYPAVSNCMMMELRLNADISAVQAAIAAERYRLARGNYPEKLTDMVPEYIDVVSLDPFDGKDMRYKKMDGGFVVYNVGEDGIDDGGRVRDPNNFKATYDYAFRIKR